MIRAAILFAVWAGMGFAGPAQEAMFRKLMTAPAQATDFAPSFLNAVPLDHLEAILAPLRDTIGPVTDVVVNQDRATITNATHRMTGRIALDDAGRVAMLFVEPPIALSADPGTALDALLPLADRVSWIVTDGQTVTALREADQALAVASAFKLGVLRVLLDDIRAGRRDWADVVRLEARHLSLPTGVLQDFPVGSPLTLHTLAAAMIAQSDNTATDVLMDVLGRDRVAEALGLPFVLTTREMFSLKADPVLADAYHAAPVEGRPAIAARAARDDLPSVGAVMRQHDPRIEWQIPVARLCDLALGMQGVDVFDINPGVARPEDWSQIVFKGGSQPGVLSLVTAMWEPGVCTAVVLNHSGPIDETAAIAAYGGVLQSLHQRLSSAR